MDSLLLLLAYSGGMCALDLSWEQSRPGAYSREQAQVATTIYHLDGYHLDGYFL